jgi:hypothetical protein
VNCTIGDGEALGEALGEADAEAGVLGDSDADGDFFVHPVTASRTTHMRAARFMVLSGDDPLRFGNRLSDNGYSD